MDSEERGEQVVGLLAGMLRELSCRVCLKLYKEATTTFCGHTFCKQCITREMFENEGQCPTCEYKLTADLLNPAESFQKIVDEFETLKNSFESNTDVDLNEAKPINITSEATNPADASEKASSITIVEEEVGSDDEVNRTKQMKRYNILQLNDTPITEIQSIPNVKITLERKLTPALTHLVMEADSNLLVKNSTTYRLALLYGCYIVNQNWLKMSKENGQMMPEERFEIQGDVEHGRTGAPRKARRANESKRRNLFYNLKVGVINDNRDTYRRIIKVGQGEVSDEYDDVIVCDSTHHTSEQVEELKNNYPTKTLISRKWIDDCMCNYELIKKDGYLL